MSCKGKSIELAQILREKIKTGEIPPGVKFETIPKFAANYQTSVATISKVFDILEDEGLIERINGSGIYVKKKAKYRIALVFDSKSELGIFSHKAAFMRHFIDHCNANEMEYTVFENIDNVNNCMKLQKQLKQNAFDVILISSRHFAKHSQKYLKNIPILPVGLYPYKWLECCVSFQCDWIADAGLQLQNLGCDKIGLIAISDNNAEWASPEISSHQQEYQKLIDSNKQIFNKKLLKEAPPSPRQGYEATVELLTENAEVQKLGIISADAIFTHGVISAVLQSRNNLWEEIFIISQANTDSPIADFSIPVSTYNADIKVECDKVFELMEHYFSTGEVKQGIHFLPLIFTPVSKNN